jgi:large subunit ribosomal protein L30e
MMAQKSLTLGTDLVLKGLKQAKFQKVFLAANCPPETEKSISHYCTIQQIPCEKVGIESDELGVVCKKPFAISVLAVRK